MNKNNFTVSFWGVRGSLPVPSPETIKYGGNTSCVQVQIRDRLFILDAGSGIFRLGQYLMKSSDEIKGEIFITHTHWDHIQGFPFFAPAFTKGNQFILYGPNKMDYTFASLMEGQMNYQHFPVSLNAMGADIRFQELLTGDKLNLGDGIILTTTHNNHPNGGLSYRFDYGSRSCCYVTDTEHFSVINERLVDFIKNTDLFIYDCNYTDEEYPQYIGWGHSTWQEGIKLSKAANVKKLVLFHHDKNRTDNELDDIQNQAQVHYPDCIAAKEGMVIQL